MQAKTIISVLAIAIGASTLPTTGTTTPSCTNPQTLACCDSIASNGTGVACITSTLNLLNPTCSGASSLACCNEQQNGLLNVFVGCIPISIAL